MRRWYIEWKTSWSILTHHKVILVLLIVQCFFSVWFLGNVCQYVQESKSGTKDLQEDVLKKTYYRMHETLDDTLFAMYMGENDDVYDDFYEILGQVRQLNHINYLFMFSQPVTIYDMEIDRKMLYGYEEGMDEDSVCESDGKKESFVKSLQVSENVFREFGVELDQGEIWEDETVSYSEREIPVVLGYEYKEILTVGDVIEGEYLFEKMKFRVSGILSKDATVSDGEELINCNRYLLLPSIQETSGGDSPTETDKARLMQQLTGIIVTEMPFDHLVENISAIMKQQGMVYAKDIVVTGSSKEESILETYSAMTDELVWQFSVLLGIMILFVIISLSATLNGFIHEYYYDFGVFLLNGAGMKDVAAIVFFLSADVIVIGDVLAVIVLVLQKAGTGFLLITAAISVVILILACIYPIRRLHQIDIYEIIGGKE